MNNAPLQPDLWIWAIALMVGFPLLAVSLGEAIQDLRRRGQAVLTTKDRANQEQEVLSLKAGEFFGEMALFSGEASLVAVTALSDLEVMAIAATVVNQMIDRQPSFAREIGQILEIRRRAIQVVKQAVPDPLPADSPAINNGTSFF